MEIKLKNVAVPFIDLVISGIRNQGLEPRGGL